MCDVLITLLLWFHVIIKVTDKANVCEVLVGGIYKFLHLMYIYSRRPFLF